MSSAIETQLSQLTIDKSDWTPVKFGDVAFEPKESVKDALKEGVEHVVGLEHIEAGDIHLRRSNTIEESTTFTRKFSPGDVLFGRRRAYLKKAAQADFMGICSGDITVMRAKENLMPELLPFIVNNDNFFDWAITHSAGGLSPRCKFKDLANYEFLLPPNAQQAEIAELLGAMDEVIQKENELQLAAEAVEDSVKRDIKKIYFDKKQEAAAAEFKEGQLEDFFVLQRGFDLTKKNSGNGEVPVISSSGISYFHNEHKCDGPGVITGRKGKIGDAFYINGPHWPHDTSLWVKDFKGNNPKFVYWFLKSINLEQFNAATAVPTLNRNVLHPLKIRFPSVKRQGKYCLTLDALEKQKIGISEHLSITSDLQKSLISQVF